MSSLTADESDLSDLDFSDLSELDFGRKHEPKAKTGGQTRRRQIEKDNNHER